MGIVHAAVGVDHRHGQVGYGEQHHHDHAQQRCAEVDEAPVFAEVLEVGAVNDHAHDRVGKSVYQTSHHEDGTSHHRIQARHIGEEVHHEHGDEHEDQVVGDVAGGKPPGLQGCGFGLLFHCGFLLDCVFLYTPPGAPRPAHRLVQQGLVHTAGPHGLGQLGKGRAHRDLGAETALEGQLAGLLVGIGNVVEVPHLHNRRPVAGEHPVKAHGVPQQGTGNAGIGPHRDTVDLAVVGHHGADLGLLVRRLKGGGEGLVQFPVTDAGRRTVQTPLGLRIAQEMLGNAGHTVGLVRLHALDVGHPHPADQVGVLAVGLIGAAPAGVPGNVDHRAHGAVGAHRPAFLADHPAHFLSELRLPGAGQIDLGGEQGTARPGPAAEVLGLQGHRDAQAGFLHKIPLDLVRDPGGHGRVGQAGEGILGEPAVPVGEALTQRLGVHLAVPDIGGGADRRKAGRPFPPGSCGPAGPPPAAPPAGTGLCSGAWFPS